MLELYFTITSLLIFQHEFEIETMPLKTYFLKFDLSRPMNIIDLNATTSNSLQFEPANFVKEISLGHKLQMRLPRDKSSVWKLNYVILSQAGCFADWHVDFSGTSVFYVLLAGEKEFVFVNETGKLGEGLASFQSSRTTTSVNRFFGGRRDLQAYRITLKAGQGVLIPAGTLHFVSTIANSVAVGTNFLTFQEYR